MRKHSMASTSGRELHSQGVEANSVQGVLCMCKGRDVRGRCFRQVEAFSMF